MHPGRTVRRTAVVSQQIFSAHRSELATMPKRVRTSADSCPVFVAGHSTAEANSARGPPAVKAIPQCTPLLSAWQRQTRAFPAI